jgi:single-stranded DNA-binding protein
MSEESGYKSKVALIGTIVSKRYAKTSAGPVLNLFTRTGNSRGQKFCIGVNIWGKPAQRLNRELKEYGFTDGTPVEEEEAPMIEAKGELRYEFWENEDGEQQGRHTVNASKVTILAEADEDEEEEE